LPHLPPAVAALTTAAEPTIDAPAHTANTAAIAKNLLSDFTSILRSPRAIALLLNLHSHVFCAAGFNAESHAVGASFRKS